MSHENLLEPEEGIEVEEFAVHLISTLHNLMWM